DADRRPLIARLRADQLVAEGLPAVVGEHERQVSVLPGPGDEEPGAVGGEARTERARLAESGLGGEPGRRASGVGRDPRDVELLISHAAPPEEERAVVRANAGRLLGRIAERELAPERPAAVAGHRQVEPVIRVPRPGEIEAAVEGSEARRS